jgi:SAM-dependent methyltransferase
MYSDDAFITPDAWYKIHEPMNWGHFYRGDEAIRNAWEQTRNETRELIETGVLREGGAVLDIGSGNARMALGIRPFPIGRYLGIEPNKRSVQFSQFHFREDPRFEFHWVDFQNDQYNPKGTVRPEAWTIPLPDASVESVLCLSLFSHLETEAVARNYVAEIFRVMKPGACCFSSWFRSPPNAVTEDPFRTVFSESFIREVMAPFILYRERGGTTEDFNDQWCLFARKG